MWERTITVGSAGKTFSITGWKVTLLIQWIFDGLETHVGLCLEAWHINFAHAPLNCDDGGLLSDAYLYLVRKKAAN